MKAIRMGLMALVALACALAQEIPPNIGDGVVILPVEKLPKPVPLFYSVSADVKAKIGMEEINGTQRIVFRVHQGKAETLEIVLRGRGEIVSVKGEGVKDWSVRVEESGIRSLLVRPTNPDEPKTEYTIEVETKGKVENGIASLLLPAPGPAAGFSLKLATEAAAGVDLRVAKAEGLSPVSGERNRKFISAEAATLELAVTADGPGSRGVDFLDAELVGKVSPDANSVSFRLTGRVRSVGEGSKTELLAGNAAVSAGVSGDGWHIALRKAGKGFVHDLIAERAGELPVAIEFEAPLAKKGDWRSLGFRVPGGVIVPVRIEGLAENVEFDRSLPVVPGKEGAAWKGFLPADGAALLAWKPADVVADGTLFFSSTETTDVRVGSGLLRQVTSIDLRVLQGKLPKLTLTLDGPGEVLSVTGEPVLGWSVKEADGKRTLDVSLSRPIEGAGKIRIEAQAALGGFPVQTRALRMVPDGALRHSGWLRVANQGAVRIEVAEANGLIQLAPAQFPGGVDETLRQVYVYRFPAADYLYSIQANQVLPEVGVTEVTVYELAETDRRVFLDMELDIREAPLREWEIEIPADHAVASVTGAAVADYVVASEEKDGKRRLKILFNGPVANRQLVSVRLERNQAAAAGPWTLSSIGYPHAKTKRGYVGAVAAAGYRLVVGGTTGVAEVPLTFFPKKVAGLQQAFRLKEDKWSVALTVEALGQSVQADVFHLYSLKAGAAYGSVLMNFFVVGAPANEWRIAVPAGIGNIDVSGQNVGRDWRREGDVVIVPLSRPVLGAGTVLLTFEQPMSARGGDISPGEVRPLNVQGERGYVQVVSPLQVNYDVSRSEGALLKLDPSELPAEFRLLSSAPTLAVWQFTARDFSIGMKIEWFEQGETVAQVVDFLKLSSQVSRDGQWMTDVRFFVKSKGMNGLRMKLPEGAVLVEAKVAGETVNARKDGNETLVPLPARNDPNQAVEVALRYGAESKKSSRPRLSAPVLDAPVVIGEWTVTGDEGRVLVPKGGNAELARPVLAESGWSWMGRNAGWVIALLAAVTGMVVFGRSTGWPRAIGVMSGLVALALALILMGVGGVIRFSNPGTEVLEYAAPVVRAGTEVVIEVANVPAWRANLNAWVWILVGVGVLVWLMGAMLRIGAARPVGLALIGAGLLSVRSGAAWFFALVAIGVLLWWLPVARDAMRALKAKRPVVQAAGTVAMICLFLAMGMGDAQAAEVKTAESMAHEWRIHDGRLRGSIEIAVRGEAGDRFLLMRAPAVLGGFTGAGLRAVKAPVEGADAYFIELEVAGKATGKAEFEMPLTDPAKGWAMPGGPAVIRQVTVRWDESGWEFFSPSAAKVTPLDGLAANESGAKLILNAADAVMIQARPKQRDVGAEETKFFAEVSDLFVPGPGVVNGRHRVVIRPSQGRMPSLTLVVPDGFTVSDVTDGPVGSWRFDPAKRELRVALEPAQDQAFTLTVETQRGAGALPVSLELEPLRVVGAAGEVGLLGLGFGEEAQPETVEVEGLSRVNTEDFHLKAAEGVQIQHAFRYGPAVAKARVKVAAVAPEVRAESWHLLSLGEDRLVLATDMSVAITRSGVFRLDLAVPPGLEVESATGESLSHWTESGEGAARTITLHLTGKTIGVQKFNLTFTGPAVNASASWQVPRVSLRGASRETGGLTVVPERGLQVRAVDRRNVMQMDPREISAAMNEAMKAGMRPGALAYRLLQADWALSLAITRLDSWVTAQVFHDATIREGQVISRVTLGYKIENAAVKSLRVRIPGLDAEASATVRATGPAVADLVPVAGEEGLWEIRFQRGVAGETKVELEYQRRTGDAAKETVEPVVLEQVRQSSYFVAIRAGGRLELEADAAPRGWQRTDWAVVQPALGSVAGSATPVMAFRVADPEGPLVLSLKRHDLADLRKLRVSEGRLTSLISPEGAALTAVDLKMEVTIKDTLRLRLPEGAKLFNVMVNDEGSNVAREGDEWLFHVFPSPEEGQSASVHFVYASGTGEGERLEGPRLNVPMENLEWRVLVPEGWKLTAKGGDFDLKDEVRLGIFRLEDYQSFVSSKRESDSASAVAMLDQANIWLAKGDQERASQAFGNAMRSNQLDDASNEDARVQLRQLKTQQAVLGLNTRRQKLVLDQSAATGTKDQLEKAAEVNPVLRGDVNYDPQQYDRYIAGNTADENAALKEIANRIVTQQLAAEPAPVSLDVTLPERGTVMTFGRSVQVDGERAIGIDLGLKRTGSGGWWIGLLGCLAVAVLGWKTRAGYGRA